MALLNDRDRRLRPSGIRLAPLLCGFLAAMAAGAPGVGGSTAQAAPADRPRSAEQIFEYNLKAVFLFNFTKFVDWPGDAFADEKSPLNLCVLGEDPFGPSLDAVVANESVNGRPLAVRRLARGADPRSCHVLFIGRAERDQGEALAGLRAAPVLTIGETERFLDEGGLLRFYWEGRQIRFEVNLQAVERTRLKISSKLLRLAKLKGEERQLRTFAVRDLPVRRKLMLTVFLASGGALLLANAALILSDVLRFRRDMVNDLNTLAAILGDNSTATLTFHDAKAADDTLRTLKAKRPILAAALYDAAGRPLGRYWRAGVRRTIPQRAEGASHRFQGASCQIFRPVHFDGKTIGTVYLESDLQEMYGRLRLQAMTVSIVLFTAALIALLFSSGLQRLISEPILDLAETAKAVSLSRDYSLRARRQSADELGTLVDAFNQMLGQIEERDARLQEAKEELEKRVLERTAELQQELAVRRETERELEARNSELRQSNKELDDFAYIASHDLKEPLRGIHNFALFLLEDYGDKLDSEGRAKLETLPRLTRRMESLIDSLLHFSRVGRVDLAMDRVDLDETLAAILDSLGPHLAEQKVEVRVPRPLPTVLCDQARVGEIFRNLVTNAVKYNDKARKWIEIGYGNGTGKAAPAPPVFYVRDNGIGIQEKHFDNIFRIFKRLHGRDQFGGGTGAGLTIVKKIVERHSGRVWVESTYGQGTTFYFTLDREA